MDTGRNLEDLLKAMDDRAEGLEMAWDIHASNTT